MSSNTASDVKHTFNESRTGEPSNDSMPSAKAMLVAAGIAQPLAADKIILALSDNSSSTNSRLSSRPTKKKRP